MLECYSLRLLTTNDGYCMKEIRRIIMIGRTAMSKLEKLFKDKNVTNCIVF